MRRAGRRLRESPRFRLFRLGDGEVFARIPDDDGLNGAGALGCYSPCATCYEEPSHAMSRPLVGTSMCDQFSASLQEPGLGITAPIQIRKETRVLLVHSLVCIAPAENLVQHIEHFNTSVTNAQAFNTHGEAKKLHIQYEFIPTPDSHEHFKSRPSSPSTPSSAAEPIS